MKKIIWTDDKGKKNCSLLRDNDPVAVAQYGIPQNPPDISGILERAKTDLHNALVEKDLLTWNDVQKNENMITILINRIIRNPIIREYRNQNE